MTNRVRDNGGRDERFGYRCGRCGKCCRGKLIQVNPYEVGRLARCLQQSTTQFRTAWTDAGAGNYLRRNPDGTCVFLTPAGCGVYADRPLVCRIYPLGRHVSAAGAERWSHVPPHFLSEGRYTHEGTIADFLATQGAEPFMDACDQYHRWVLRAAEVLGQGSPDGDGEQGEALADLTDMDAAISAYCDALKQAEPGDIEVRKDLHLEILYQRLEEVAGGNDERRHSAAPG